MHTLTLVLSLLYKPVTKLRVFFSLVALVANLAATAAHAKVHWDELNPQQKEALSPLSSVWPILGETRQRKWLEFSKRYEKMSPQEKERAHERMKHWVSLTPEQRQKARENFREAKRLPPEERQKKWENYKELPDEEKKRLAQQARERRQPGAAKPPVTNTLRPMPAPADNKSKP
jgi:hypothetical protein